jgi:nickel-dependent lactate racemase
VNPYQAQKALDNAAHAVKEDGTIILVAECGEGFGNETFQEWMLTGTSPDTILSRLEEHFVLGGHKAAAIAAVLKRAAVYLVSGMPAEAVRRCGLVPFDDAGQAIHAAFSRAGDDAQVIVMPEGGSVLPTVAS